ncbi:molybdopterin biosynthesis protein [Desulfovibrio aminophilus]|nr:molybdopterin biosynthesis protein [Desulfovibrio aminophilus]MCM0755263.1 molybdopterin biosynthesis protein [Desulfovibrio aminophilus]
MDERNIYLTTVPVAEAVERVRRALDRDALLGVETVASHEALGRVTSRPVIARCSSPTFHAAAMDGIAVRAESTFAAREGHPVTLRRGADYVEVNTGHPLPPGMDAVVMIEHVIRADGDAVFLEAPAFPWQHVRRIGEDIVATEMILPQNRTISAYDVGALLSAGIFEVEVRARVRLTFIPTGDEVLDFRSRPTPAPGQVIESNSQVFAALVRSWGAEPVCLPPVPDDRAALKAAVASALEGESQIVCVGAGSSAGSKDFTRAVFEELGQVLVHGVAVMPGKPSLLTVADNGKLLAGVPGYPVSAVVCLEDLLAPLTAWLARSARPARPEITARLARKLPSRPGMEEIVRLAVGRVGDGYVAAPLPRGAGLITSLTKAQGLARIPADSEGLEQDAQVRVELLTPRESLDRVLVHIGSHDNIIDMLGNELMGLPEPVQLVSSHVGSMGGLSALRDGTALFAGSHLFDPETEDFNFPFLARYLAEVEVLVVNLAIRHQGLIVAPGNPKDIRAVSDLARPGVAFINRQKGAGTRILLDHHLKTAGIRPEEVRGYEREEFTHMAVAVNVLTGAADCGLGIYAAAKALGLDFLPLARERYDLVIPRAHAEDPRILALLELVRSERLQAAIQALGGYETTLTGRRMRPGEGLG